jgi:hypothetical protein
VKASAKAKANVDTSIFMVLLLTVGGGGARRTPFQRLVFHPQLIALTPDFLDISCTQSLQTQFSIVVSTAADERDHEPLVRSNIAVLVARLSA